MKNLQIKNGHTDTLVNQPGNSLLETSVLTN